MRFRISEMTALALLLAVHSTAPQAGAQMRSGMAPRNGYPRVAQHAQVEELPRANSGGPARSSGPMAGEYVHEGYSEPMYGPIHYGDGACADGGCYTSGYGCEGYGDGFGYGCGDECSYRGGLASSLFGWFCPPGNYYVTADYIYARANFSDAVAFLDQVDDQQQGVGTDTFHELDFRYEQSYRFGGGYRLGNCNEEIRFMFTRLSSTANAIAPFDSIVPYGVAAEPGGETFIHADVDVKMYDLEYAKTIQLGGGASCGCGGACGGACGCGDPCGNGCAPWDVTWSGGFRFADVRWNRSYFAANADDFITTTAISAMDFRGGGVRLGLEGRRYFCENGCFSIYLKGDLSLLLGDVDLQARRDTFDVSDPEVPTTTNTQTYSSRQIIPVTEIETGLTGHITCNTSITTGYMFSAWHDLGFRDEFDFDSLTLMATGYDDANILGFDGFFARLEVAF